MLPVRQLGLGGVNTDAPRYDLPPNIFTGAYNVVFRDGKAQKAPGWIDITFDAPLGADSYWFQGWENNDTLYTAFAQPTGIKVWNGTNLLAASIFEEDGTTPKALSSSEDWQSDQFGGVCIMNNRLDEPLYSQTGGGTEFAVLPGWGAANSPAGSCKAVRSFKAFLIALGASNDDYTVFWSDESAPDSIPQSWDYADPSNLAGFNPLQASDGELVDGLALGDAFIVYTESAAYAMRLGGSGVFTFQRLFSWGLINRDCVVDFENQHFCIGNETIYVHDGYQVRRIADSRVENYFFDALKNFSKVYVTKDIENHEIIVYFAQGDASAPNQLMIWNWLDNTWTFESLESQVNCIKPSQRVLQQYQWNQATFPWAQANYTWDSLKREDPRRVMMMLADRNWYERGSVFSRDGSDYYSYLERRGIDLDEMTGDATRAKYVRGLFPQIEGAGKLFFQVGGSFTPTDQPSWGDIVEYDIATDYKVDTRVTGRYLAWRIGSWTGTPAQNQWRLSAMDIDVELVSER